jgi:hypothetical protein
MEGWRQRRPGSNENKSLATKEKSVLTRAGLLMEGLRFVVPDKKSPVTYTIIRFTRRKLITSFLKEHSSLSLLAVTSRGREG